MLQQWTHFPAIRPVSITHWEEMAMSQPHDMWRCNVGILVDLERVVRWNASFGCEREFGDNICDLTFRKRGMPRLFALWTTGFDLRLFLLFRRLWMGSARCRFSPCFGLWFDLIIVVIHVFVLLWRLWFAGLCLKLWSSRCRPFWVLCLLLDALKALRHYLLLSALGPVCRIERFGGLLCSSLSSWLHSLLTLAELPIRIKWLAWAHWPVQVGSGIGRGSLHWLIRCLL